MKTQKILSMSFSSCFFKLLMFVLFMCFLFPQAPVAAADCKTTTEGNAFTINNDESSCVYSAPVDGVDQGTGDTNEASLVIPEGKTLVIQQPDNSAQTLAVGSFTVDDGGTVIIPEGSEIVVGARIWLTDADGDGYVASGDAVASRTQPANTIGKGSLTELQIDCNDSDPDHNVTCSTLDTGSGEDGSVTFSSTTNLNTQDTGASIDRNGDAADGWNTNVTGLSTSDGKTTATVTTDPTNNLVIGDEVLLINLQGTSSHSGNVGNYEFLTVDSLTSTTVVFTEAKTKYYGDGTNSDDTNLGTERTNQRVMLQRVPHYTDATVNNGISLTASAWDGAKGGVLAFRANGTVTVTGLINAFGLGYSGGAGLLAATGDTRSYQGESYNGLGAMTGTYDDGPANGGGGGGGFSWHTYYPSGGAGGGYGSIGSNGGRSTPDSSISQGGTGGGTYGDSSLTQMFLGSGGGGAGRSYPNNGCAATSGSGGNGGGIVYISAKTLTFTGSLTASGNNGGLYINSTSGCYLPGSAGGSGGTIQLLAETATLGTNRVWAVGGRTQLSYQQQYAGAGADGGWGRIGIYGETISGNTNPVYASLEDANVIVMATLTPTATPMVTPSPTPPPLVASGGTITDVGDYRIHTFTSNGTFSVTSGSANIEILIVGGGGGGGSSIEGRGGGGGGGGGGVYSIASEAVSEGYSQSVVVGAGGAGGAQNAGQTGTSGSNSSFGSFVALGGGGGGNGVGASPAGLSGGSGGGAGYYMYYYYAGAAGTSGQGNAGGGNGGGSGGGPGGGGGGGAGEAGYVPPGGYGAYGGHGISSDISGSCAFYGGGGAGGYGLTGGLGGGGFSFGIINGDGTANTGGGGGGTYAQLAKAGNGGSGIVIVRYPYP